MIVLAGKNNIAVHALELLCARGLDKELLIINNKNDYGKNTWQQSLKLRAEQKNLKTINLKEVKNYKIDLILSLEFDKIISTEIFEGIPSFNFHFSELPKYKGMHTSVWPILNNEQSSAVTIHKIDRGIDTGDICAQEKFKILPTDRSHDLYRKYISTSCNLLTKHLDDILNNSFHSTKQPYENSSYYSTNLIDFSQLTIDLNCTAWQLKRKIYAFSFREYQLPIIHNEKVVEVDILDSKSTQRPGTLLYKSDSYLIISTIDYDVKLYIDKLDSSLFSFKDIKYSDVATALKGISGVHDRNSRGWSPIIIAAYHGNIQAIEKLLELSANINDQNYNGTSVIMYAKDYCLKARDNSLMKYLIDNGADPYQKDFSNRNLFDYLSNEQCKFLSV